MANDLQFQWRFGDYELRATPKCLVRISEADKNETVDFIKWSRMIDGRKYCYSIGYFWWNDHEPCWELKFVGDRFACIPIEDMTVIWPMLKSAYDTLTIWKEGQEGANHDE